MARKLYPGSDCDVRWADRDAGQFHPRIFMGDYMSRKPLAAHCMNPGLFRAWNMLNEHDEILTEQLKDISRTVTPTLDTKDVYGARIRNLLIMACTEVETQFKGILLANGYPVKAKDLNMLHYAKASKPLRLGDYEAGIDRFLDYPAVAPFKGWDDVNTTLPWYKAYNLTKHDAEEHFKSATLEHALSAVVAVGILALAQFGDETLVDAPASFLELIGVPEWSAHERTYPPPPAGQWTSIPLAF